MVDNDPDDAGETDESTDSDESDELAWEDVETIDEALEMIEKDPESLEHDMTLLDAGMGRSDIADFGPAAVVRCKGCFNRFLYFDSITSQWVGQERPEDGPELVELDEPSCPKCAHPVSESVVRKTDFPI